MIDKIVSFFRTRDEAKQMLRQWVESDGFKVFEFNIRGAIKAEFAALLTAKPEDIRLIRDRIETLEDVLKRAYHLGGFRWEWTKYTDYDEYFKNEKSMASEASEIIDEEYGIKEQEDTNA